MSALFPDATFITFLTGFLGSGKTTALNSLLRDERLRDTAVIVNEFGAVGLDHLLISQAEESVVLLDSGCICCTIGNGLSETLETLYRQRLQGLIPYFNRVVVETTGLADPFPMLKLALGSYFVSKHFAINGVLTTVDGVNGLAQLLDHREARNQIAVASHVVITKADLCEPAQIEATAASVRQINSITTISVSRQVEVSAGACLPDEVFDYICVSSSADEWLKGKIDSGPEDVAALPGPALGPFNHDARIDSHAFFWEEPVAWERYAKWIEELRRLPQEDLLRVKGLVELGEHKKPYIVQGVQHLFASPVRLPAWPSGDHRSRVVVIARGIQKSALDTIFSK